MHRKGVRVFVHATAHVKCMYISYMGLIMTTKVIRQ
jgi:hypothetical protein